MTIQENLVQKMNEAGITQAEISEKLGMSRQAVNIKLRRPGHGLKYILKIADCAGMGYRILDEEGKIIDPEFAEWFVGSACTMGSSVGAFEEVITARGWTFEFIRKTESRN